MYGNVSGAYSAVVGIAVCASLETVSVEIFARVASLAVVLRRAPAVRHWTTELCAFVAGPGVVVLDSRAFAFVSLAIHIRRGPLVVVGAIESNRQGGTEKEQSSELHGVDSG